MIFNKNINFYEIRSLSLGMLGTSSKVFFPSGNFPSDNFPRGNFPNVQFPKHQLPKSVLAASHGPQPF